MKNNHHNKKESREHCGAASPLGSAHIDAAAEKKQARSRIATGRPPRQCTHRQSIASRLSVSLFVEFLIQNTQLSQTKTNANSI